MIPPMAVPTSTSCISRKAAGSPIAAKALELESALFDAERRVTSHPAEGRQRVQQAESLPTGRPEGRLTANSLVRQPQPPEEALLTLKH